MRMQVILFFSPAQVQPLYGAGRRVQGLDYSSRSISMRLVFEPRTDIGTEHFARLDMGSSQIFKLIVSTSEKMRSNIEVLMRGKLAT